MQLDTRPLPPGWITETDHNSGVAYYVCVFLSLSLPLDLSLKFAADFSRLTTEIRIHRILVLYGMILDLLITLHSVKVIINNRIILPLLL